MKKTFDNFTQKFLATSKTYIKVEGHRGYFHILDVATVGDDIYVLLEHNVYGDEANLLVITLPTSAWPLIISRSNGVEINVGLGETARYAIFIPENLILAETYDDIITTLQDNDIVDESHAAILWSDEEIDTEII